MPDALFDPQLFPHVTADTQAAFRFLYGLLLLGTLLQALPQARRFFLSERWGGYGKSSPYVDAVQNPVVLPIVLVAWFAAGGLLVAGRWTVWAALANVLLCHYFFIGMRWRGVLRGMGAPGFMTYWVGVAVLLLELTRAYAPGAQGTALLALQVDLALVFLSAGVYKLLAGYRENHGVDLGLANPQWGYWWRAFRRARPDHGILKLLNHLGWATEVAAAVLMLLPPTRFLGGALILFTFALIRTQIRLGLLCEMVMLATLLYFHPGSLGQRAVDALSGWVPRTATAAGERGTFGAILAAALVAYLVLVPLVHAGLAVNLYGRRLLPLGLQPLLERVTGIFGIIVWRVFSADVVDFFVHIHRERRDGGGRELLSRYGWRHGLRYAHVGEAITITSLFTTIKYYPSNPALFEERLLRYARTVPCPADCVLVFEYRHVAKGAERFEYVSVAEFTVDPAAGTVSERRLSEGLSIAPVGFGPVHEAARPGTYAPVTR